MFIKSEFPQNIDFIRFFLCSVEERNIVFIYFCLFLGLFEKLLCLRIEESALFKVKSDASFFARASFAVYNWVCCKQELKKLAGFFSIFYYFFPAF